MPFGGSGSSQGSPAWLPAAEAVAIAKRRGQQLQGAPLGAQENGCCRSPGAPTWRLQVVHNPVAQGEAWELQPILLTRRIHGGPTFDTPEEGFNN